MASPMISPYGVAKQYQIQDIESAMRRHKGVNYKSLEAAKAALMGGGIPEEQVWNFLHNRATGRTSLGIEDAIVEWNRRNKTVPSYDSLSVPYWDKMISVSEPSNQFSASVRRYSALSPQQREHEDQQQRIAVQEVIKPIYRNAELDRIKWNRQVESDKQMMQDQASRFQKYLQTSEQQRQLDTAETKRRNAMTLQLYDRDDAYKRVLQSRDPNAIRQFLSQNQYTR